MYLMKMLLLGFKAFAQGTINLESIDMIIDKNI